MPSDQRDTDERIYAHITATGEEDVARAVVRDTHELTLDEPPFIPYGNDTAPCPGDYLMLATGGCQVEVLRQCFEKARIEEYEITLDVEREQVFPDEAPGPFPDHTAKRYRSITMDLAVTVPPEYEDRAARCVDVCEDACIISQSVQAGIDIELSKRFQVAEPAD